MRNHTHRVSVLLALLAGLVLATACTAQAPPAPGGSAPASASPSAALVTPDLIVEKIGCSNPRQESSVIGVSVACNIGETYFGIFDFKTETEATIADMISYQGGGYARFDKFLIMTSDAVVGKEAFAKLGVEGTFQATPEEPVPSEEPTGPIVAKGDWAAVDSYSGAEYTFSIGKTATGKAAKLINEMDGLRELVHGKPVYYLVVNIDNTNGKDTASINGATIVDVDGNQIESVTPESLIEEWQGGYTSDGEYTNGEEAYDWGSELYNKVIDLSYKPKSKGFGILIFKKAAPKEVLAIYLNDTNQAYKVE